MGVKVKWVQRGRYAGLMIRGKSSMDTNKYVGTHIDRVISLASAVESSGLFGTVMNYDGTGMTAGIAQCIALYPREIRNEDNFAGDDQGPLWKLVEAVHDEHPDVTKELYKALRKTGWSIKDGVIRRTTDGSIVSARILREILSPPNGVVPSHGLEWETTKRWGLMFHKLFSNPKTFDIQIENAKEHIVSGINRKPRALKRKTAQELVYDRLPDNFLEKDEPLDLALACLWSNAVNAPAPAYQVLADVLTERPNLSKESHRDAMAAKILLSLKNTERKNWQKRYKRTRKAAMKIWPKKLFKGPLAVMS